MLWIAATGLQFLVTITTSSRAAPRVREKLLRAMVADAKPVRGILPPAEPLDAGTPRPIRVVLPATFKCQGGRAGEARGGAGWRKAKFGADYQRMRSTNVRSIRDLKTLSAALGREVCEGGQPVIITQHGKAKAVLMDVKDHDRLRDSLAMLKLLAQSQASLAKGARTYSTAEVRASACAVLARARRNA